MKQTSCYLTFLWFWAFCFSGVLHGQEAPGPQSPGLQSPGLQSPGPQALLNYLEDLEERFPGLSSQGKYLDYEIVRIQTGARQAHPGFPFLYSNPMQFPSYAWKFSSLFLESGRDPEAMTYLAFRSLASPAGGWGPPLAGSRLPASISLDKLLWTNDDHRTHWEQLPSGFRNRVLSMLGLMMEAKGLVDEFTLPLKQVLGPVPEGRWTERLLSPWENRFLQEPGLTALPGEADLRTISLASRFVASGLRSWLYFSADFELLGKDPVLFDSPVGRVGIFGHGDDTISGDFALIINLGGNDLYESFKAGADAGQSISILLDLTGNDHYVSQEDALVQATMGLAVLLDREGDDVYLSGQAGLASATYGFSLLYDMDGDDSYKALGECSLGSAHVGVGILVDLMGDDRYLSESRSLGFGGCLGLGMLLDLQGDDTYNSPQQNPSFVLGSARGRWAEFSDGRSLGGGLGLFMDARGRDHYYSGSFSQGASYYTGQGIFCDLYGDDSYEASSHSQGFAAHYSLASFLDYEGNDHYNEYTDTERITQSLGGGRDLSFASFLDCSGNDLYHFGNRSVGIGDMEGLGLFWDCSGEDQYIWHRNGVNRGSASMGSSPGSSSGSSTGRSPGFAPPSSPRQAGAPRFFKTPQGPGLGVFCDDESISDKHP